MEKLCYQKIGSTFGQLFIYPINSRNLERFLVKRFSKQTSALRHKQLEAFLQHRGESEPRTPFKESEKWYELIIELQKVLISFNELFVISQKHCSH